MCGYSILFVEVNKFLTHELSLTRNDATCKALHLEAFCGVISAPGFHCVHCASLEI